MPDELSTLQIRLELSTDQLDRELKALEMRLSSIFGRISSSAFNSRFSTLNPDIDPNFEIKPLMEGDTEFVIPSDDFFDEIVNPKKKNPRELNKILAKKKDELRFLESFLGKRQEELRGLLEGGGEGLAALKRVIEKAFTDILKVQEEIQRIEKDLLKLETNAGPGKEDDGRLDSVLSEVNGPFGSASGGAPDDEENTFAGLTRAGTESAQALEEAYTRAGTTVHNVFGDMFKNGKLNFESLESAAVGALDSILNKIFEIVSQELFGGLSGGGGFFGKLLGSVGKAFLGGAAGGGAVQPATPVLVGERGPEIFVPKTVGSIMPNSAFGGVGGGQTVVVNQTIRFDVGLESVDSRIRQSAPVIAASAASAIREQNSRDPFGRF